MPNVYLQKDLGMIGDFLHSYRKDITDEFYKNIDTINNQMPKDFFTKPQRSSLQRWPIFANLTDASNDLGTVMNLIRIVFTKYKNLTHKVVNKIVNGTWWDKTDHHDNMFHIGNWKMKPLIYNKRWVWDNDLDRFQQVGGVKFGSIGARELVKKRYPKTAEMLDKIRLQYGEDCIIKATYSLLTAGGYIPVHRGLENHDSVAVRCHIPLIIPKHEKNEMYLEVHGDRVYWTETFGFDNQAFHTATNKTQYNRLVFMVDITRKALSLPKQEKRSMPFTKRLIRKLLRLGKDLN